MIPDVFQHQAVRDLAWLLTTPQLCHCTAESWQIPAPNWDTLVQLDVDPRPIERWLEGKKTTLLGHYHEHLWLFYFHTHPELELLSNNLVIQGKHRTLGEFDVLLKDLRDGLIWHLELAIKFYLGTDSGWGPPDHWSHWLGTACQDSMEHKWQRLQTRQLTLGQQDDVRKELLKRKSETGQSLIPDRASALTRGYLFYPDCAHYQLPPPKEMNPEHLRGRWIQLSQWLELYQHAGKHEWRICRKPHWMAPPSTPSWLTGRGVADTLTAELCPGALVPHSQRVASPEIPPGKNTIKKRERKPQMGTEGVLLEKKTGERIFVVSDGWPGYIPLPWHKL